MPGTHVLCIFIHLTLTVTLQDGYTIVVPVFQMEKVRPRGAKKIAQGWKPVRAG